VKEISIYYFYFIIAASIPKVCRYLSFGISLGIVNYFATVVENPAFNLPMFYLTGNRESSTWN